MITNQIGKGCGIPAFVLCALLIAATGVRAQVSNSNPTGPAGVFNGNITTGCSYDPLTGNATRSVTDLVVTGSVGTYPLAFARTTNSRQAGDFGFGSAGGWRHSYSWDIDSSEDDWSNPSFHPTVYPVSYPDGRLIYFTASPSDPYFRGPPGVRERFQPLDTSSLRAYLILPDGGKIEFKATKHSECDYELIHPCRYTYSYQAQAIIDPHGIRTALSYYTDGSLSTIQEKAGRSIQIYYTSSNGQSVIDHIQSSDGRIVQYHYAQTIYSMTPYTNLDTVTYPLEPALNLSPTAHYIYQAPNGSNPNGFPLLSSCDDPMYAGPMKQILYTYAVSNGDTGGDPLVPVAAGQILSENHPTAGMVSRLYIPSITGRNEVRGDGPSRRFEYKSINGVPCLWTYTDFQNHLSTISYENGFTSGFEDARHHYTSTQREPLIGAIIALTHPDPEQSTQQFNYKTVDGAPYFLQIRGDERLVNGVNSNTFFTRDDVTNRVKTIWYPDYPNGPKEEFTYNGFGQIETHTATNGGVENFRYDGRGLMYLSWPPATPSDPNPQDHPTHYFYYTSGPQMDRLRHMVDPRNYSTTFEYNTRGQVTKVTHDQDGSYTQSGYNVDGTRAWTADENHPNASWNANERTRYIYDDYKRVTGVTNPVNETTNTSYAPPNGAGSYSHTTSSVYRVASPMAKIATFDYDENFHRTMVRKGAESSDDDGGTWFDYDEVGNLKSVQDPRGWVTTFAYDERNRRTSMTDPIATNRNSSGHTFDWEYDTRGNLTKETRADGLSRRMEYDPENRVIDTYGFANEHVHYERDLAGNVKQLTDPKPVTYLFDYDKMNRKIGATYPLDATGANRTEGWHYDFSGNMDQYTNPAGQIQTLGYDTRNRLYTSSWGGEVGPTVGLGYDDVSRLGIVVTYVGGTPETTVVFGYDAANRKIWEDQTVVGGPTRRVETPRDHDGNLASVSVAGRYGVSYDYTKRGQLWHIKDGNGNQWFTYSYDLSGNLTKRQDVYAGVNDSTNVMDASGVSQYDALNRPMMWEQVGKNNGWFARSYFNYDSSSRIKATWRDEQASKGEWYDYDPAGPLHQVKYNASQVWTDNPLTPSRTVTYTGTSDTLNRATMVDNGYLTNYTPNLLNQYGIVSGGDVSYDDNFNLSAIWGFGATYDAESHLTSATSGEEGGEFIYDGLGRCLKRTINGEFAVIVYDGWKPILEVDAWTGSSWNVYGPAADEILYRHDAIHGDLRYHLDRMGNVAFILDSDGDGIEKYTYDAFGRPTVTTWTGTSPRSYSWYGNRFMFQGREYLSELGISDFRNRFYHPGLGRFLQKDPSGFSGGDANLFRYCGGDPVNRVDPSGLGSPLPTLQNNGINPGVATTAPVIVTAGPIGPALGGNGLGILGGGDVSGSAGESFTTSSNYTPTGSHIPQSRTATRNGNLWSITYYDAINGSQYAGTFALVSGGTFGGVPVFVPAVSVIVETVIRSGLGVGTKSLQAALLTASGVLIPGTQYVGYSPGGNGISYQGSFQATQFVTGTGSSYTVMMAGTAYSALFPKGLSIDYSFGINVNFGTHTASVQGYHDGYPSYNVSVGGTSIYDWNERNLLDLRAPMEVSVNATGRW